MKSSTVALLTFALIVSVDGTASADPFDWKMAADTGGIWAAELGRDEPGEIRSLIGRTTGGRHHRYLVSVIIDGSQRVDLIDEMGNELPKLSFISRRIVVTMVTWPTGADTPSSTTRCFGWNAASRTYLPAACP